MNNNQEIERKFLLKTIPKNLDQYEYKEIEQAYISLTPTIRIRKSNDEYFLTIKGHGLISKAEFELSIKKEEYEALLKKTEGNIIKKRRYNIPLENNLIAELDIYYGYLKDLYTVEVEFLDEKTCNDFIAPSWFGEDISHLPQYKNSFLSKLTTLPV